MEGAATPPRCDRFLVIRTRGVERPRSTPANGLQAFGLNEASGATVMEESRDCPPLLIAPDNFNGDHLRTRTFSRDYVRIKFGFEF